MKEPTPFHKLPSLAAGAKMPSEAGILLSDVATYKAAKQGSDALRDAVRKLLRMRPWL